MSSPQEYDAVVIGSGIGGLLAAAGLCQQGKTVVVLERLSFVGGRFTAIPFKGTEVTTGAIHTIPHGSKGPFGCMLRSLDVPHQIHDADVFASFRVGGKHFVCHRFRETASLFSPWEKLQLVRMGIDAKYRKRAPDAFSFEQWMRGHTRSWRILSIFERFTNFALSVSTSQISYNEGREVFKKMRAMGRPGIPHGGCRSIVTELEKYISLRGGAIRTSTEVLKIIVEGGVARGVRVLDRKDGAESTLHSWVTISDIGPNETFALLEPVGSKYGQRSGMAPVEATGLKVHFLSNVPLIDHRSVMFCLDTQRVAAIVQPTNADPKLAPPGKHLLISHQILKSDDISRETELALSDFKSIFGPRFDRECEIICVQTFVGGWPVNRAVQGRDASVEGPVKRLYMVGDGCKPSGYIMVEGVAKSVKDVLEVIATRQEV